MKFDQMCAIVLEKAGKAEKFANLVIGNATPSFSKDDVLRDPTDPSKGLKLYLSLKDEKQHGWAPGSEQSIRRGLRRVNWVARTIIKEFGKRASAFSIDDMNKIIMDRLERYQTKILGMEAPDKANTGYEARVIGNLLLPPTKRNPNGKSVLMLPGMDPNATVEAENTPVTPKVERGGKVRKYAPVTPRDLKARYDEISEVTDDTFDPDLKQTIRDVVGAGNATRKSVMKDERISGSFNPTAVKEILGGLIKAGEITEQEDGTLAIGAERHAASKDFTAWRERQKKGEIEASAEEIEGEELPGVPKTAEDMSKEEELELMKKRGGAETDVEAEGEEDVEPMYTPEQPATWKEPDEEEDDGVETLKRKDEDEEDDIPDYEKL